MRPARFERATYGFGDRHSIQLSYERMTTKAIVSKAGNARNDKPRAPHYCWSCRRRQSRANTPSDLTMVCATRILEVDRFRS